MAVFIVLWPYLLTTKLRSVIRHNLGHSNLYGRVRKLFTSFYGIRQDVYNLESTPQCLDKSGSTIWP